ncbi:unnamed protein product [Urochloa decumbens]|uniref:Protein kinase domain-containing protein n=1 Tax=Urochloa decumbens TaxID=240449 RepID=A0ABC9DAZ3_9POAL
MPSFVRVAPAQWLVVALATILPAIQALPPPSSNCQRFCGNIGIPYPFGIGQGSPDHCALPGFYLSCNDTGNGVMRPFHTNVEVQSISLLQGRARMLNHISTACYNSTTQLMDYSDWHLRFHNTPYRFSDTSNKFTVIGCQSLAYISDNGNMGKYMSGCVAMCEISGDENLSSGTCSGIGCCQTAIPKGMQYYRVRFAENFNTTQIYNYSRCSYAVLMDSSDFNFQESYVTSMEFNNTNNGRAPLVIDWAIGNETCEVASKNQTAFACVSSNSECIDSTNGPGYICNCSKGFEGNPYLHDPDLGCKDIDECKDKQNYPCYGTCHNTPGGYDCFCPSGTRGDANNGPCVRVVTTKVWIAIGICTALFFGLIIFLAVEWIRHKQMIIKQDLISKRDAYFRQHGGQLLIDMMKIENISFKLYTREEIELATNNFDDQGIIGEGGQGTVFKGHNIDSVNNPVAIKRCKKLNQDRILEFGQELLILSRVTHKNIVKLLGCSLHFEAPVLVYEFVPNNTLHYLIHVQDKASIRTLGIRMRIAAEAAEALAYLHTLNRPIFHGDVKSANILLDHNLAAKVSDFGCSMIMSAEENLQAVKGTMGYLDPEYLLNFELTDKSDVYSFGVVLLELLTRRTALSKQKECLVSVFKVATKEGKLLDLVDREIVEQDNMVACQVAGLADKCLAMTGSSRPTMSQVAEELRRLVHPMLHGTGEVHAGSSLAVQAWSSTNAAYDYTSEATTDYYSQTKKAPMSIEFAI